MTQPSSDKLVTDAMIEAGVDQLSWYDGENGSPVVEAIYRVMEAARPLADTDELLMSLVEPITKAIVFEDCGNTTDWQENTNLGIAAVQAIKSALAPILQSKEEAERERVCPHGVRHPWQCDDCDRENPMPEGWKP